MIKWQNSIIFLSKKDAGQLTRCRSGTGQKYRRCWMLRWLVRKIGGLDMIDLYIALIIAGKRTIDQVPTRYREAVVSDLLALGLDETGQPLPPGAAIFVEGGEIGGN